MATHQGMKTGILHTWAGKVLTAIILFSLFSPLIFAASALASPPRVICVPQVPTDLLVPHDTWSGEPTTMKGIARDDDGDLAGGTYYWEFGDGAASTPASITDPGNLAATHTYTAAPGTLFVARLHVTDASGESSSDDYRILIRAQTLDVEINKAIDDGLWWIYTQREATGSYSIIPNQVLFAPTVDPGLLGEYFNNTTLSGSPVLTRVDPEINFYWGGSPGTGVNSNYFSVRWTGEIQIDAEGEYLFRTYTDDGIRVYIDNNLIISNWTNHGSTYNYSGAIYLASGRHDIRIEFYEASGGARMQLYWSPTAIYRWSNQGAGSYTGYYANPTASAVQAFEINGHLETGDPDEDPYVNIVKGGIDYLLSSLTTKSMTLQAGGHPEDYNNDGDGTNDGGNGVGLSVTGDRPIYETGAVMDALVASGTPDATARMGSTNVVGRRYQDIVQDMVDVYSWGMDDAGDDRGGWRYSWSSDSDNSAAQWAAIGIAAAERHFGCLVPDWVKTWNNGWLNYSYNSGTGRFGYETSTAMGSGNGYATTPSGMVQLSFDGLDTTDVRWQGAEAWLASNWNTFISASRSDRYYSYYAFAKAMRLALPNEVTHLSATGLEWYGDETKGLARILVDRQNANGSWPYDGWPYVGTRTAAAWNVIILTRTLFEKPPVAVIDAEPNPGALGQTITFDASESYHLDPAKAIVEYLWDFDASDGVDFVSPDATGVTASWAFGALRDYTVSLKVIDNSTPARFDTSTYTMHITIPPHPPTAVIGGPYIGTVGEPIQVDGSGSYDIDESEGDSITAWDWESDFVAPYDFGEVSGEVATLPAFSDAGRHDIALRVTDNTLIAFPTSGEPNLTNVNYGEVMIYHLGAPNLEARPKGTKCQLTWSHIGASAYKVLRSEKGPNEGYEQIGTTASTYSTFLDYNLAVSPDPNRCLGDLDQDGDVDGDDHAIFLSLVSAQPPDPAADLNDDGVVDTGDVEFFAAEFGRSDCFSDNGIELNKDYWYRIQCEIDGVTLLSVPVYVYSGGRIVNAPPLITTTAPLSGQVGEPYQYDVDATDPEGLSLTYILDMGPSGMSVNSVTGLITWTPSAGQEGPNDVMVRVQDADMASSTQFFTVMVAYAPNAPPVVNPNGPYEALVNEEVSFNSAGSSDPNGTITDFHWVFGDGTDAHGPQVIHTYTAPGTYVVTLYATDNGGATGHAETSCQIGLPNRPPVADPGGPYSGEIGAEISFDGILSYDPDNDSLTYTWNFGDSTPAATGVQVTHAYASAGVYTASLSVDDGRGGIDTTEVEVTIRAPNNAPVMETGIQASGNLMNTELITFTAAATDPDNDPLFYAWDFGDGSTANGQTVTHAYETAGDYTVSVTVSDGRGGAVTDTTTITISLYEPNRPPSAEAGGPYTRDLPGDVTLTGTGMDPDDDSLTYEWKRQDTSEVFSGQTVTINFNAVGLYHVLLTVTDGRGGVATDTAVVSVADPSDITPPVVTITTPDPANADISQKIQVVGTANDANFVEYTLEISSDKTNWTTLAQGDTPVVDGVLGVLDPTTLRNDLYRLRLRARDVNQESTYWIDIQVSGELKLGKLKMSFRDVEIPVAGIPITITRSYDSFYRQKGDFGHNWTLDIKTADIKEDSNHNVMITLPDGRRVSFAFQPVGLSPWFPGYDARFIAPPWVHDELDFVGEHLVNWSGSDWYWFSGVFDPDDYILRTKDGRTYEINQYTGVKKVTDRNDNSLTITENGVFHSSGKSIAFTRDAEGRIEMITDPAGQSITYTYDANGDLVNVTYPEGYVMTFEYNNDHFITRMIDPEGRAVQQNEYDAAGRLIASTNDEGARVEFQHDVDNNREVVTDARGNTSEARFNDHGLKTMEIDPLGNKKIWTYDGDLNIIGYEIQDPGGNALRTMGIDYNASGSPTTITLPDGGTYQCTYNAAHKWDTVTLPSGEVVHFTYDADYNLTQVTDALGSVWTYSYDGQGNPTTITDPLGRTTQHTYDAFGNILAITDPCGGQHLYERDDIGHALVYTRPDGATTSIEYNDAGRPVKETDPVGNVKLFTYDSRGNKTSVTDENGNRTLYEYNSRDKLTRITYADGAVAQFTYDENGNLKTREDANGAIWIFSYDEANRMTSQTDPLGNTITYEHDADGYTTAIIDKLGRRTEYKRDPFGRIDRVIDADGKTTRYEYDSAGNLTRVIDANGHITSFEYDAMKHLLKKILPGGETFTYGYNAAGNMIKRTDAIGNITTYTYDNCNHLTAVSYPGGSQVQYAYDSLGNRTQMTDSTGMTAFSYDLLNRTVQMTRPGGASIAYQYDAVGNIVSVTDPEGAVTKTYDNRNRLVSVLDRTDRKTTYAYDAMGNTVSLNYPNGIDIDLTRDSVGLIKNMNYSVGDPVQYSYDAVGNVLTRMIGTETTTYGYDPLNRLVSAVDPASTFDYTYDAVGNRIILEKSGITETLTYNANDQMDGRSYDANGNMTFDGERTYAYDFENRLVRILKGVNTIAEYQYDGDGNRVGSTVFLYDGSGNPSGQTHTDYLIDTNGGLPSVILATQDGTTTVYTYGRGLISRERGGDVSYYLRDAVGSTLGLAGASGAVTDTFAYDPFGNLAGSTGSTPNPFLFTGEPMDKESGLYYLRARHYDPATGRFISRDPAQGVPPQPMSFHPYLYGMANPLRFVDHTGRQAMIGWTGTIVNNPLQWLGAFLGGVGAGYASSIAGYTSMILDNIGKPMNEVLAAGFKGALLQFLWVDYGNYALSVVEGTKGALLQAINELMFLRATSGKWEIRPVMANLIQNLGQGAIDNAMKLLAKTLAIPDAGIGNTFKFFSLGKSYGAALAMYNLARAMCGTMY